MKKGALIFISLSLTVLCIAQETISDRELFDLMRQEMRQQFEQYRRENDLAYAAYLQQTWVEYQVMKGLEPYSRPKPDSILTAITQPSVNIESIIDSSVPQMLIPQTPQLVNRNTNSAGGISILDFKFYGIHINLKHHITPVPLQSLNPQHIIKTWLSFSTWEMVSFIAKLIDIKQDRNLNDWAFFELIREVANQMPQLEDGNMRILFRHYVLHKCGFFIRMGKTEESLVLLLPTGQTIYRRYFLREDDKQFYIFTDTERCMERPVSSVPLLEKPKERLLSLQIKEEISLGYNAYPVSRSYKEFVLNLTLNHDRINFFSNYPQTDFHIYINAKNDKAFEKVLLMQLYDQMKDQKPIEALQWLLHFTQSAFSYLSDQKQFGTEKYFFPEETFFYPYSDCDDRAILFSFLVRRLLRMDIVLLEYEDHLATAVYYDEEIPGKYISNDGKRYYICDPTYTHADIGQCMPRYDDIKPEIIKL